MPIHELNTLYWFRDRLAASHSELRIIFEALLGDSEELKPGWYWFREEKHEIVIWRLIFCFLGAQETRPRIQSLKMMQEAQVRMLELVTEAKIVPVLHDLSHDMQDAVWEYLVETSTIEDLSVLETGSEKTWLAGRIDWLRRWIKSSRDLTTFLKERGDLDLAPDSMKATVVASVATFELPVLRMLEHSLISDLSSAVRAELHMRGAQVPEDEASKVDQLPGTASTLMQSLLAISGYSTECDAEEEKVFQEVHAFAHPAWPTFAHLIWPTRILLFCPI